MQRMLLRKLRELLEMRTYCYHLCSEICTRDVETDCSTTLHVVMMNFIREACCLSRWNAESSMNVCGNFGMGATVEAICCGVIGWA